VSGFKDRLVCGIASGNSTSAQCLYIYLNPRSRGSEEYGEFEFASRREFEGIKRFSLFYLHAALLLVCV
jgi:hypothetical protein